MSRWYAVPEDWLLADLAVAELHRHPDESVGWWLRFRSTEDRAVFDAGREVVRALPVVHRQWVDSVRMWWVSDWGMICLGWLVPALRDLLPWDDPLLDEAAAEYVWHQHSKALVYGDGYYEDGTYEYPDDQERGGRDVVIHCAHCRHAANARWDAGWVHAPFLGRALRAAYRVASGYGRVRFCRYCLPSGRSMKKPLIYRRRSTAWSEE